MSKSSPNADDLFRKLRSDATAVFEWAVARLGTDGNPWSVYQRARRQWQSIIGKSPIEGPPIQPHEIASVRRRGLLVNGILYPRCAIQEVVATLSASLRAKVAGLRPLVLPKIASAKLQQMQRIVPVAIPETTFRLGDIQTSLWAKAAIKLMTGKTNLQQLCLQLIELGVEVEPWQLLNEVRRWQKIGLVAFAERLHKADLIRALRRVGVQKGDILVAHTSLSGFGYVDGGADTVIDALLEAVGAAGTVAAPTHSLSWVGRPPYDRTTASVETGTVPSFMLKRAGAIRSMHPTHSVVAIGPAAERLVRSHDHQCAPHGRQGFWGKFVSAGGRVVLMCPLTSNTLLHSVDVWAGVPYPSVVSHRICKGRRIEFTEPLLPWEMTSFPKIYEEMFRQGLIRQTSLGSGTIYSHLAADAIEVGLPVVQSEPQLAIRRKCRCWYCRAVRKSLADADTTSRREVIAWLEKRS